MAKTDYKSVDHYIAAQPEQRGPYCKRVRDIVKRAVPGAEELISYQIPAYRHEGGYFLYISGWKAHYSLYPATEALVAALKDDIAPYLANKNTIRFKLSDPVPARLIERIAKLRAKEVAEKAKAKAAKARPPSRKQEAVISIERAADASQGLFGLELDAGEDLPGLEIDHGDFGARRRIEMESEPVAIKGERRDRRILGDAKLRLHAAGRAPPQQPRLALRARPDRQWPRARRRSRRPATAPSRSRRSSAPAPGAG